MDQISNMIVSIKNAQDVGKTSVSFPYSNIKFAIVELLQKEGFIKSFEKKGKKTKYIEVELVYGKDKSPKIRNVERISKFSRRIYSGSKDLKPYKDGFGMTILTTPKGILTDKEARKQNVGGEVLFKIW